MRVHAQKLREQIMQGQYARWMITDVDSSPHRSLQASFVTALCHLSSPETGGADTGGETVHELTSWCRNTMWGHVIATARVFLLQKRHWRAT